jgi:tripartite-type tricarboxylate transporter receptor subunit TctC
VSTLRREVQALLARPDVVEKINVSGSVEPLILSPEDFSERTREDYAKFGKLVKQFNIRTD